MNTVKSLSPWNVRVNAMDYDGVKKEFDRVINNDVTMDSDCVTLYDVKTLVNKKYIEYEYAKNICKYNIEGKIESKYGFDGNYWCVIYDFDFKKNELVIGFNLGSDYFKVNVGKKNNEIYVYSGFKYAEYLIDGLDIDFAACYESINRYSEFFRASKSCVSLVNSKFFANINFYGVDIFARSSEMGFVRSFLLSNNAFDDEYIYNASDDIQDALVGNEEELFKKLYIRIEDCPGWCRDLLKDQKEEPLVLKRK